MFALALVSRQSFAKNFGLYGERIGNFSILCKDADEAARSVVVIWRSLVLLPCLVPSLVPLLARAF